MNVNIPNVVSQGMRGFKLGGPAGLSRIVSESARGSAPAMLAAGVGVTAGYVVSEHMTNRGSFDDPLPHQMGLLGTVLLGVAGVAIARKGPGIVARQTAHVVDGIAGSHAALREAGERLATAASEVSASATKANKVAVQEAAAEWETVAASMPEDVRAAQSDLAGTGRNVTSLGNGIVFGSAIGAVLTAGRLANPVLQVKGSVDVIHRDETLTDKAGRNISSLADAGGAAVDKVGGVGEVLGSGVDHIESLWGNG